MINESELRHAISPVLPEGGVLCLHASLRSFDPIEGGARTLLDALLDGRRTLLAPAFFYDSFVRCPPDSVWLRNGISPDYGPDPEDPTVVPYAGAPEQIDRSMGALPREMLRRSDAHHGDHPLDAFVAIGPEAESLTACQSPLDAYAPYRMLEPRADAWLLLMGVGLSRATPVHFGETLAGRDLFHRWALREGREPVETRVGGCSEGFGRLDPFVADLETRFCVCGSTWRLFHFGSFAHRIAATIRRQPDITHCGDPACERCRDAVAGGPVRCPAR